MKQSHNYITGSGRSAANLLVALLVTSATVLGQQPTDVSGFAGTWAIRFDIGLDRVYRIAPDGSFSFTDRLESKTGNITVQDGQFIAKMEDRIQRFTKMSATLLKVEAFASKSALDKGQARAIGTGMLEGTTEAAKPSMVPKVASQPTTSVPAPQTAAAVAPTRAIKLKTGWDGPMQGGTKTIEDLAFVLNGFGKADANPPFADIEIFSGVKYLMPVNEAVAALGLNQRLPSAKKLICPGLPKDSFSYISFDGVFEGHFKRLDLVTDTANQVVSVQLVDEAPKDTSTVWGTRGDWLTFNFVGYRTKSISHMKVEYVIEFYRERDKRWLDPGRNTTWAAEIGKAGLLRVDAVLTNKEGKRMEETRWYVPKPLADLIMHCISKAQR